MIDLVAMGNVVLASVWIGLVKCWQHVGWPQILAVLVVGWCRILTAETTWRWSQLYRPNEPLKCAHGPESFLSNSNSSNTEPPSRTPSEIDDDSLVSADSPQPDTTICCGSSSSSSLSFSSTDRLAELVPGSTHAERERFYRAKQGIIERAAASLAEYIDWRARHDAVAKAHQMERFLENKNEGTVAEQEEQKDVTDWRIACAIASYVRKEDNPRQILPRVARTHTFQGQQVRCRDGHRVVQILPGRMDDSMASLSTYSLAIALYIDRKLDRDSLDRLTVLIDVRGGQGWPNIHPTNLLSFLKDTALLLLSLFPERLARSLVFPVPAAFGWIWTVAQRFIDPLTAEKVQLITGIAKIVAEPPSDQLALYLEAEIVDHIEHERRAAFFTAASI